MRRRLRNPNSFLRQSFRLLIDYATREGAGDHAPVRLVFMHASATWNGSKVT